jgi:hypothetical protein
MEKSFCAGVRHNRSGQLEIALKMASITNAILIGEKQDYLSESPAFLK